jgi:hypothetical protein
MTKMNFPQVSPSPKRVFLTGVIGIAIVAILRDYTIEHNFHDGIDNPVIALELVRNQSDLRMVLGADGKLEQCLAAVKTLHANTMLDLIFIPLYVAFLWLFTGNIADEYKTLRNISRIAIVLAGLVDYVEDFGIFRALRSNTWNDSLALQIRWSSLIKWALLGVALGLTAAILIRSSNILFSLAARRLCGIAFGAAAVLLLTGLSRHSLIELGATILGVLIVLITFASLGPSVARLFPTVAPEYEANFCKKRKPGQAPDVKAVYGGPSGLN